MNKKTEEMLFSSHILSTPRSLKLFDLKNGSPGEGVYSYPTEGGTADIMAERCLCDTLLERGYEVYKPLPFNLLVNTPGKSTIIVMVLDSESERRVWEAMSFSDRYSILIIRDRREKEPGGLVSLSLDEALDSFNF